MTEVPKNAVVGPFFSPVICFLAQSVSVTELRAVSLRQRSLSYDSLIASVWDSPDSPIGPALKLAEGSKTRLLFCSLARTELREIWSWRITSRILTSSYQNCQRQRESDAWAPMGKVYNMTLRCCRRKWFKALGQRGPGAA